MASSLLLLALAAIVQAQDETPANGGQTQQTPQETGTATGTQGGDATATATGGGDVAITGLPDLSDAPSVGAPTSVSVTSAPDITSSAADVPIFHLTGVPTIAGYGIPSQQVPWTAGAPFMQTSNMPEGTVFIIVGAVLGFLGAAVLMWRGIIAWSLHRSVKRAALGTSYNDSSLKMSKPNFSTTAVGSTLSLDRLSAPAGRLSKVHNRREGSQTHLPGSTAARNSSLFFSPTAGAGAHHSSPSAALMAGNNRSSAYLPAGYYAAPNSTSPAAGAKQTSVGGALSSLNPMHPSNKGYSRQTDYAPSPPDSPSLGPYRPSTSGTLGTMASRGRGNDRYSGLGPSDSWGNLNVPGGAPAGQRAPSANLEDLFEHHGNGMRSD